MSTASDSSPLCEQSASELTAQLAAGEVTSAHLVEAHIARWQATHERVNALVQPMFDAARQAAQESDQRREAGQPLGPLEGLPVTIKDCFAVAGGETTLGIPGYSKGPAEQDAPLVARLRGAGAVILGKTNVPQAMLLHECDNPVFGRTNHPEAPNRSPGGSTGGEAAAVAAGCSTLGLGSDLGGSIRQPAAACGVCGFKPTSGRLTLVGSRRAISPGMQAIPIQPGPIARSVADLDLAMRALTNTRHAPLEADESMWPWPEYRRAKLSGLRVACWIGDGIFPPAEGLVRAVEQAAGELSKFQVELLSAKPPDAREMMRIYLGLLSADGMAHVRRKVRGGPVHWQLARQTRLARLPRWSRFLLGPLLRLGGQKELSELLHWSGARSADSYWRLTIEAENYRQRFWSELDERCGGRIDAVLSPPFGLPALRHGTAVHLLRAASHTFLANLLGAPAGVVPVGKISPAEEQIERANRPASRWNLTERFAGANAVGSAGLPLAVEVMARPGRDDLALALLAAIESTT